MKRFHVHVHVDDLARSVAFYSKLFAAEPARLEGDYAKWMLDDPRVNFAISARGGKAGIDHLGFQVDEAAELAELKSRAESADMALLDEGETTCCYARSEKHWVTDPQGIAWEHFHTLAGIPVFSEPSSAQKAGVESACCAATPAPAAQDASAQAAGGSATASASASAGCCGPTTRGKPVGIAVKSANRCC
jgi:catechol 2,3-dioxygenase-like lactoylglutathione lyase family enzyme